MRYRESMDFVHILYKREMGRSKYQLYKNDVLWLLTSF